MWVHYKRLVHYDEVCFVVESISRGDMRYVTRPSSYIVVRRVPAIVSTQS